MIVVKVIKQSFEKFLWKYSRSNPMSFYAHFRTLQKFCTNLLCLYIIKLYKFIIIDKRFPLIKYFIRKKCIRFFHYKFNLVYAYLIFRHNTQRREDLSLSFFDLNIISWHPKLQSILSTFLLAPSLLKLLLPLANNFCSRHREHLSLFFFNQIWSRNAAG